MSAHEFVRQHVGYPYCQICCHVKADHPTPAYVPQVGDRVRFAAEGVVMTAGNDATYVRFTGSTFGSNAIAPGVGTWERLPDPLPTTPGSVVLDALGSLYALNYEGSWVGLATGELYSRPGAGSHSIEHDAGATP